MGKQSSKISLQGIPETMLLTLYNRAVEAKRLDCILKDPEAIRIYESINFDFSTHFGQKPRGGMAARAVSFDQILTAWLKNTPDGYVVSLGEGLETQRHRVDNGKVRWLSIDLPEAIELREQFLKMTDRFKHLSQDAFDPSWMDKIGPSNNVFIVAQGLFMYFEEGQIRNLITEIFRRFPKAHLLFDFVSDSFVLKTKKGLQMTENYKLPAMKWGIGHDKVEALLNFWLGSDLSVQISHYDVFARGIQHVILDRFLRKFPIIGNQLPGIVYLKK